MVITLSQTSMETHLVSPLFRRTVIFIGPFWGFHVSFRETKSNEPPSENVVSQKRALGSVQGLGFRVWGLGLGFRVKGLGLGLRV